MFENWRNVYEKCFRSGDDKKMAQRTAQDYEQTLKKESLNPMQDSKLSQHEIQDEDVKKEEQFVAGTNELAIKVSHLKKVYTIDSTAYCSCGEKRNVAYKVAVKDVTFGIEKGQCFG